MKKLLAVLMLILLVSCGGQSNGYSMEQYNNYLHRVDVCIVENGTGLGVKAYCESFARLQSTPTPKQ